MSAAEFEAWKNRAGVRKSEFFYCNGLTGLTWVFTPLPDGWIGVWEYNNGSGEYTPRIQAKDVEYARSWCMAFEALPVGADVIF